MNVRHEKYTERVKFLVDEIDNDTTSLLSTAKLFTCNTVL